MGAEACDLFLGMRAYRWLYRHKRVSPWSPHQTGMVDLAPCSFSMSRLALQVRRKSQQEEEGEGEEEKSLQLGSQ